MINGQVQGSRASCNPLGVLPLPLPGVVVPLHLPSAPDTLALFLGQDGHGLTSCHSLPSCLVRCTHLGLSSFFCPPVGVYYLTLSLPQGEAQHPNERT